MWNDKSLELLVPHAIRLMECLGFRHARASITTGVRPPHEDYRETWRHLTEGQRAYLSLFLCATSNKQNSEALGLLCRGDMKLFDKVWKDIYTARNSYVRDIVNVTHKRLIKILEDARKHPQQRRPSGWTAEDIAAEYFDDTGEPAVPRLKKVHLEPIRDISGAAGPARKVSTEEYLATRRNPVYGGVKLEYDVESENFAKEKLGNDDRVYDGTTPDETI